uniref:Uncharacterized protein n=1 Tax=Odontella aurita TaxID=265563 RepID=A0A7S4HNF7_9STRA|mmetsp:Transcript_12735/g.37473  ORF Transcript_12735/g.37473 Transcript_12735/m.37473 type:complete len:221 (+) Transcript_12735:813-1475(+)
MVAVVSSFVTSPKICITNPPLVRGTDASWPYHVLPPLSPLKKHHVWGIGVQSREVSNRDIRLFLQRRCTVTPQSTLHDIQRCSPTGGICVFMFEWLLFLPCGHNACSHPRTTKHIMRSWCFNIPKASKFPASVQTSLQLCRYNYHWCAESNSSTVKRKAKDRIQHSLPSAALPILGTILLDPPPGNSKSTLFDSTHVASLPPKCLCGHHKLHAQGEMIEE